MNTFGLVARALSTKRVVRLTGLMLTAGIVALTVPLMIPAPVQAFVCSNSGAGSEGADSGDIFNTACGTATEASGAFSTAIGNGATASGSLGTATGLFSKATGDYSTAYGGSTTASGLGSTTAGNGSTASGSGSSAFGLDARASGEGSTAVGGAIPIDLGGGSIGINGQVRASGNYSTAIGTASSATATSSIAIGSYDATKPFDSATNGGSQARGDNSIAIGTNSSTSTAAANSVALGATSTASGANSIALGLSSAASSTNSIAIGNGATSSGLGSVALGQGATAAQGNATAIGNGATTTRANQIAVGTNSNTYTLAGLTSSQSLAAQTGATSFVTTDANGNLAASGFSPSTIAALDGRVSKLQSQLTDLQNQLGADERKFNGGLAAVAALGGLVQAVTPGKSVVTGGYGYWGGQSALSFGVSHRFQNNWTIKSAGAFSLTSNSAGGSVSAGYEF